MNIYRRATRECVNRARLLYRGWLGVSTGAAIAALLCLVAIAPGQQAWVPANAVSYGKVTRDALDRLLSSGARLRDGDTGGAQQVLQGMGTSAGELTRASDFFRERANRENIRCVSNIGTLENDIAETFDKEQAANRKMAALQAELTGITEKKNYSLVQLEKLKTDVESAITAMRERERKLEQLKKWWWVPGYGLYLGIRTLVDDDIGKFNSLRNTLRDKSVEMSKHQGDWQAANQMLLALTAEQRTTQETHQALIRMRSEAEANLANLKRNAVFLTEAGIFWGRVSNLVKIQVTRPIDLAAQIQNLNTTLKAEEKDAPLFHSSQSKPFADLYGSLAAFADTIDQGNNFLLAEGTQYCGGPPRGTANVSSACQIDATRFYKIVDPVTCSFQYRNPPGCPPRPRETNVTEPAVASGKARGTWSRADGQNWVGRARCDPESIYYGTVGDQDSCERKCMSDSACVTWTFNQQNGMIGGTVGECWGGTAHLKPLKEGWSGFQSGGTPPPAFKAYPPAR